MQTLRGQLLIAGSGLVDPNFRRAIVLIGHHDQDGAVGVILNRPTETRVREAVPPLGPLVGPEDRLFIGGPVQTDAAVILAEFEGSDDPEIMAFGRVGFLTGDVDVSSAQGLGRVRIFAGYAGWGPGQLEAEMEEDAWILEPAGAEDVFADDPEGLWARILRRKGGDFALMATMPVDPSTN
ncbi:MAG TPA: YqgE/AlgH family protein [Actinomycetota bacterium]